MTESQQRDALAEAFPDRIRWSATVNRWQYHDGERWVACKDNDPLCDLNALYEAENKINLPEAFASILGPILLRDKSVSNMDGTTAWHFAFCHAFSTQRTEALLRTLGKWKD